QQLERPHRRKLGLGGLVLAYSLNRSCGNIPRTISWIELPEAWLIQKTSSNLPKEVNGRL
ncbi:MAG: hypothetical protein ABI064_07410, partial [Acidobacteriaceae bacterium]